MQNIPDTVANIIAEVCGIARETVVPGCNLGESENGLGIDSLDMLDVAFAIEKHFGIKLKLDEWNREEASGAPTADFFSFDKLCEYVADLVAAKEPEGA